MTSYYERKKRRRLIDVKRRILRARVKLLFDKRRQSAGTRTIVVMLRDEWLEINRFKDGTLMKEQGLTSKQSGKHAYKQVKVERPDIPNLLNRQFVPEQSNQAWCGDITYLWTGGAWHYAAVVIDLYARRVIGWSLLKRPDAELASSG